MGLWDKAQQISFQLHHIEKHLYKEMLNLWQKHNCVVGLLHIALVIPMGVVGAEMMVNLLAKNGHVGNIGLIRRVISHKRLTIVESLMKIVLKKIWSNLPTAVHEESSYFSLYYFIFFFVSTLLPKSKALTEQRLSHFSQCLALSACIFRELIIQLLHRLHF